MTTLSPFQQAFLRLHVLHQPEQWRWYWFEMMLRATAGRRTATLWADELAELLREGLMEPGMGMSVRATAAGVALVMAERAPKEEVAT